eukprot:gb/GECG01015082.1/.p1 GENE.gb/GECG01015082.1/~~gb/GECG01015082.1/.p1  ORF type:complete len:187 (+),score=12.13 gb/GECG01015082.1/:1-561(+)
MSNKDQANPARLFGSWIYDRSELDRLRQQFADAVPFPHVVIDDFLHPSVAKDCARSFPEFLSVRRSEYGWMTYYNPIEIKLANNQTETWGESLRDVFFSGLQSMKLVEILRYVTGIPELENDPHIHGGGLHCHPRGGKLDMHLDYSIHPITGMERRLNLIIFLAEDWDPSYGGDLQLWDEGLTECQ